MPQQHPNLTPIEGTAARLDVPSLHSLAVNYRERTVAPGPGLVLHRGVAMECLQSIPGIGINALTEPHGQHAPYSLNATRHKVGFISGARIEDDLIRVSGYVYGWDFPDVISAIQQGGLGMCLSLSYPNDSEIIDGVIHPRLFLCTGVALLRKECCGFPETGVALLRPEEQL